ncbi:trace amine-associated receptor 7a-like [Protopterus annectens]|uniref:trace amine-associated receptor 7a-like n=1 Tax=Protopterus annectens TaxID=7888 RepID=UPI001CFA6ADF|nr:trace amine-associated receptor 7a-like [Protopterus annectens]
MSSSDLNTGNLQQCYENINGSCTRTPRLFTEQTLLYIIFTFVDVLCVTGNLMVIISVSYFKQLHSSSHLLVLSLAFADFLLGLLVLPFNIIRFIESCWYFGEEFCRLHTCIDGMCCLASIFHLCFISIDRYYAVSDPLTYPIKFTASVTGFFIGIGWLLPVSHSLTLVYSNANNHGNDDFIAALPCKGSCQLMFTKLWVLLNMLIFLIPFIVMLGMYSKVFIIAKKQARMIESAACKTVSVEQYNNQVAKRERKAAKTLGIAVGAFAICWFPYFVDSMINTLFSVITPQAVSYTFLWIAYLNSALNPLIYAFFYPWFRETLKLILTCKILKSDYSDIDLFND